MTTDTVQVLKLHEIPEWNMVALEKEVAKLNRRAKKLGIPGIAIVEHGDVYRPDPHELARYNRPLTAKETKDLPHIRKVFVEITGEGPKIEGYRFVGTLDHHTIPGLVLVHTVPGERVPGRFFDASAICGHCDKKRNRTETFIFLKEDDGTHIQVGRSCLKDFFGHDPSQVARFLSRVISFVKTLADEDGFGGMGGYVERSYPAQLVLANTVAMIRTFGWVPRSKVDANSEATASNVSYLMTPVSGGREKAAHDHFIGMIKFDDGDEAEAEAALEWLDEQDGSKSEYMHNLKALATLRYIPVSKFGYWCSVVSAYQRAQERLVMERKEKSTKLNEYLGEVNERIEATVECVGIKYIDSNFGPVCIHRMLDSDGRTLVWFANTDAKMKVGDKYRMKGTVKKHDEFNDWKQTQLKRVTVIEEINNELVDAA